MHKFIQAIGALVVLVGVLIAGAALTTQPQVGGGNLMGVLIGASIALPGAMLYCFGAIVEHLAAIRRNTDKQLAIFAKLGKDRE